ncbi:hypothetical protein PENCOP_c008G00833 [Penicillium coprophilum]|uniref:Enoyl reductase (ER) domain-containing protein n=1 Tax=Penicillium coprophilum TaxID=36646 RepID=A0A1V6UIU5_9EURO|nr:hypothetical protein PENCOP_c008G00833 [Penicillium coprophilum]
MSSNQADQAASDQVVFTQDVSDMALSHQAASNEGTTSQDASDELVSIQDALNQVVSNLAPSNLAAWFTADSPQILMVGPAPYTPPSAHQIVIKNAAVAISTVDWAKQLMGSKMSSWIKHPFVLGNNCAGKVVQVGDMVSDIKIGDRVLAHALSMDPVVNNSSEGAFQHYTVVRDNMVTVIPEWLSYEEACVVPLSLSTAATALFQSEFLSLNRPGTTLRSNPNSLPEAVLIWGGSTSVGCNAIQLAALAGYEVITTCAPHNFEYVTTLGASAVFDYLNELTVPQIIHLFKGKTVVGAIAIGNDSTEPCMKILAKSNGSKFVAQVTFPFPEKIPTTTYQLFRAKAASKWSSIKILIKSKRSGVKTKLVFGSSAAHTEVGSMIYREFLPEALAGGTFVTAPKPLIAGKGLEHIQKAMDWHLMGVSARKLVVSL